MANKFSNFRARTLAEKNTDNNLNAEFIETHASSTVITHSRISEDIKAVLTRDHNEGVDEVILFTKYAAEIEDNLVVGDYLVHDEQTYLIYMEFRLPAKFLGVFKKYKIIECNFQVKVDNISQYAAYIGSLKKFVSMTEQSTGDVSLGVENYKPVVVTKNNTGLTVGKRFLLGTEAFEIVALDRLSNAGIMYISVNAVPYNATLDNLQTGTAVTAPAATINATNNTTLRQGESKTVTTNFGYIFLDPGATITSRTLTSVTFLVPYNTTTLQVDTKNVGGSIVTTNYTVVI
jgi:hypothetical protein